MNFKTFISSLKGLAIAFFTAALLLFAFALFLVRSDDPMKMLALFAYAAMFVGGFAGGYTAVRFNGSDGIVCGALTGGLYAIIIVFVSLFIPGDGCGALCKVVVALSVTAVSAIGGFAGLPKRTSPEKRRKMMFERAGVRMNGARRNFSRSTK